MDRSVVAATLRDTRPTPSTLLTQRGTADTPGPQHMGHSGGVNVLAAL